MSCVSNENCGTCLFHGFLPITQLPHISPIVSPINPIRPCWWCCLDGFEHLRLSEFVGLPCSLRMKPALSLHIISYPSMLATSRYYFRWWQWQPASQVQATKLIKYFSFSRCGKNLRSASKTHPARAPQNASTVTAAGVCLLCPRAAKSMPDWTAPAAALEPL